MTICQCLNCSQIEKKIRCGNRHNVERGIQLPTGLPLGSSRLVASGRKLLRACRCLSPPLPLHLCLPVQPKSGQIIISLHPPLGILRLQLAPSPCLALSASRLNCFNPPPGASFSRGDASMCTAIGASPSVHCWQPKSPAARREHPLGPSANIEKKWRAKIAI